MITRAEAVRRLQVVVGQDLVKLAPQHGVTIFKPGGGFNKGWAGHTIERAIGLGLNSSQSPDGIDFELKVIPVVRKAAQWVPKETMAITMINAEDILAHAFSESHLWRKLNRLLICVREFVDRSESKSRLLRAVPFDCVDAQTLAQIKADYDEVREVIRRKGFSTLSGKIGTLIQPRTKGAGHGSTSRAFYARIPFLSSMLDLAGLT